MTAQERPRILYVAKEAIVRYTTSCLYFALPNWLSRHCPMALVCPRPPQGEEISFKNNLVSLNYIEHGFRGLIETALTAARVAIRENCDVVITGIDEISLLAGIYASVKKGCPLVVVCHDHPFLSRYHDAGNPFRLPEKLVRIQVLRLLLRRPALILCFIEKEVLGFLKIPTQRLMQMRNGFDD